MAGSAGARQGDLVRVEPVESHDERPRPLKALPFRATKGLRQDIVIEYDAYTPDKRHKLPMSLVVEKDDVTTIGPSILELMRLYRELESTVDGLKAERDQLLTRQRELEGELATATGRVADLRARVNHGQKATASKDKSGA